MNFTPGIFKLTYEGLRPGNRVHTTPVKQLALYFVIYSPFQMATEYTAEIHRDGDDAEYKERPY